MVVCLQGGCRFSVICLQGGGRFWVICLQGGGLLLVVCALRTGLLLDSLCFKERVAFGLSVLFVSLIAVNIYLEILLTLFIGGGGEDAL